MARKKPTTNRPPPPPTPPPLLSSDEEEASERNDVVKEAVKKELETPVKKGRESDSNLEDYSEDKAPSPNVSDFVVKPNFGETPEVKKPRSKRSAVSEPSRTQSKEEKFDPSLLVVLGLPKQDSKLALPKQVSPRKSRKLKLDSKAKEEVSSKIDSKRLSELMRKKMHKMGMGNGLAALDVEMGVMGGEKVKEIGNKWRKLQQQMLELYIKRLELVQEQTRLVLDKLESSEA